MKIYINLPGKGEITIEREPWPPYKFYTLCWAVCLSIVLPVFFSIFK